jgi:hypothetical protein
MSYVFSQGHVSTIANIRRQHPLPVGAGSRVIGGQFIKANEIIAISEHPTEYRLVDAAAQLRVNPAQLSGYLLKREGESVQEDEVLASRRIPLRFRPLEVLAPIGGFIRTINTGKILIEGIRERVEIHTPIPGRVFSITPDEYIVIELKGVQIQLPWGRGESVWGTLKLVGEAPSDEAEGFRFNIDHRGAIVAMGTPLTEEILREASDIRVRGLIGASMHAKLAPLVQEMDFPVGITQGFGRLPMSDRIFNLLKTYNGREMALAVSGEADWREMPPEIIIPIDTTAAPEDLGRTQPFAPGQKVRILQAPYLGEIGTISSLSEGPEQLESGLWMPGAYVEMPTGETQYLPFTNLEQLI